MSDAAELDECWICDAKPEPCEEHPAAPLGPRGCTACNREAFAEWLARVGPQRICDGSGMRHADVACPGCVACATVETPCPAFASPDEPWIPDSEKRGPCACCGGPIEKHRQLPSLPDEPPCQGRIAGFKVIGPDGADLGTVGDILRGPR
jgi:hypothetical protein